MIFRNTLNFNNICTMLCIYYYCDRMGEIYPAVIVSKNTCLINPCALGAVNYLDEKQLSTILSI